MPDQPITISEVLQKAMPAKFPAGLNIEDTEGIRQWDVRQLHKRIEGYSACIYSPFVLKLLKQGAEEPDKNYNARCLAYNKSLFVWQQAMQRNYERLWGALCEARALGEVEAAIFFEQTLRPYPKTHRCGNEAKACEHKILIFFPSGPLNFTCSQCEEMSTFIPLPDLPRYARLKQSKVDGGENELSIPF